jgi:hypothetical protein
MRIAIDNSIRKCSNYDPNKDVIKICYEDSGIEEIYLEVKYRVLWFLRYCEENGKDGFIDDSDVVYDQAARSWIAKCSIYIDGELVGKSAAGKVSLVTDEKNANIALQSAATAAKGRALANAGFGTVNCSLEEGDKFPCDSGIRISKDNVIFDQDNPMEVSIVTPDGDFEAEQEPLSVKGDAPQQKETTSSNIQNSAVLDEKMSLDEAKAYVLPLGRSEVKGKTLWEIFNMDKSLLKFYASERFKNQSHASLKTAAQIICISENVEY